MRDINLNLSPFFILAFVLTSFLVSCDKDDDDDNDEEGNTITITSIQPETARVGDTISINGTGFSTDHTQIDVTFTSNKTATIHSATTTLLRVIVPDQVSDGPVTVAFDGDTAVSEQDFILDTSLGVPVISAINPANGYVGSEVTITGENFSEDTTLITVLFNDIEAELTSASLTEIRATVPQGLSEGEVSVYVKREDMTSDPVIYVVDKLPTAVRVTYWSSQDDHTINRGVISDDGVDIEVLYDMDDGVSGPLGIALDAANGILYWCNQYTQDIMKAPADGSGSVEVIFGSGDGIIFPSDIAVDTENNSIYFTDYVGTNEQYIRKGDLTNNTLTNIYTVTESDALPFGIKLAVANNKLYWAEWISIKVYEGSLDGSVTPLLLFDASDGLSAPTGIAIDDVNSSIFIVDNPDASATASDAIYKGSLDGTGTLNSIVEAGDDLHNAMDLEIDEENGYIFWMNNAPDNNGNIKRAALDGTSVETLFGGINNGAFFDLDIH